MSQPTQPLAYRWNRQGRKGQRCRVVARSCKPAPISVLLEFADGYRMVTSGNALKKASEVSP